MANFKAIFFSGVFGIFNSVFFFLTFLTRSVLTSYKFIKFPSNSSYSYGGSSYGGSSYGGSSYGSSSYGGSSSSRSYSSYGPAQTSRHLTHLNWLIKSLSRYRDMVSNMYGGLPTPQSGYSTKYTSQYSPASSSSYSVYSSRGTTLPPPTRGASIPPPLLDRSARTRTVFRYW